MDDQRTSRAENRSCKSLGAYKHKQDGTGLKTVEACYLISGGLNVDKTGC